MITTINTMTTPTEIKYDFSLPESPPKKRFIIVFLNGLIVYLLLPFLPTAYVVRDGRLCFQSVHTRGLPHLYPIILPL